VTVTVLPFGCRLAGGFTVTRPRPSGIATTDTWVLLRVPNSDETVGLVLVMVNESGLFVPLPPLPQ
jgi:hypothetical protein